MPRREPRPPEERFEQYVERVGHDGCWLWIGANTEGRYGQFFNGERSQRAHRWAYEHWIGPIPEDHEIDHLCNVTLCVRPDHLEPVTNDENQRRASLRRSTCRNGHPHPGVYQRCKPCAADRSRRYRQQIKEKDHGR